MSVLSCLKPSASDKFTHSFRKLQQPFLLADGILCLILAITNWKEHFPLIDKNLSVDRKTSAVSVTGATVFISQNKMKLLRG